jgi:hypothetical protein
VFKTKIHQIKQLGAKDLAINGEKNEWQAKFKAVNAENGHLKAENLTINGNNTQLEAMVKALTTCKGKEKGFCRAGKFHIPGPYPETLPVRCTP